MHRRGAARRLAIVREVWRELPRYGQRHLLYLIHSERDAGWGDLPLVVPLRADGGLSIEVVPRDAIGRFLYLYGLWDLLGTRFVQAFLRPGMAVLDIGANIGYFTLLASPRVGASGLVESFEPHDEIRRRLLRNIEQNGLANVTVRPEALASASGETRFYSSADAANQGLSSTIAGSSQPGQLREERPSIVPAIRLDDAAERLQRPVDLIKLDVEGGEKDVFAGGERLLSVADAPVVLFESFEIETTAPMLEALGFGVARLRYDWRRGLRLTPEREVDDGTEPNYVAYKERHAMALRRLW